MKKYMELAIASASEGFRKKRGGPFWACIVKGRSILAVAHNSVLKDHDPTCHAEINAIRAASAKLRSHDLSGCIIYSTTEPCPMCFAAIHWAQIDEIVFGTTIGDVCRRGFNELLIRNSELKRIGKSPVRIRAGFMKSECQDLLSAWDQLPDKEVY